MLVVIVVFVIVCALLIRRGYIKFGHHGNGTNDVEAPAAVDVPYAIPRPGRLWLGKSSLAAYDAQTVYTLPPGFRRNGSLTETVITPPAVEGRLYQKRALKRLDSAENNAMPRDVATVNSRLMPLDSLFRSPIVGGASPPSRTAHLNRIPRPILQIGVFNIGSGAVASADHDLSAEFFCNPPTPTGGSSGFGRNTLAPTASVASSTSAIGSRHLHRSSIRLPLPSEDIAPADFGNPFLPEIRGEPDGSPFDFLDEYGSVGSGSSHDDGAHVHPGLPSGTHLRPSDGVSGADGLDLQRAPQDPATWPETPVDVLATFNRTMRRTVSHDESSALGPAAEGGVRVKPTLYRQRRNWNFDGLLNNEGNECRRSNVDFTNIGRRPVQGSTSGIAASAAAAAADINVIRDAEDDAAAGSNHLPTMSNGHITAGEEITTVSQEPDAMFAIPNPIIKLPVRFKNNFIKHAIMAQTDWPALDSYFNDDNSTYNVRSLYMLLFLII